MLCIDEHKKEFIEDRKSGDYTNAQLAIGYECSIATIISRAKKWNIIGLYIDKHIDTFILDKKSDKYTIKELATKYKCSTSTVSNRIFSCSLENVITEINGVLTQKLLKKILKYDKNTGIFTWKETRNINAKNGSIAGSSNTYGYISITINYISYRAHRLAFLYMTGSLPPENMHVDHINHIRDCNSWANLRLVTKFENARNQALQKRTISGIMGVSKTIYGTWKVEIKIPNTTKYFQKYYKTKEEAIIVANAKYKEFKYHDNHGYLSDTIYKSKYKEKLKKATPKNQTKEEKKQIKEFYANTPKGYEVDHIQPISKGGLHELSNLQYLTIEENRKKGSKLPYKNENS